MMSAQDLVFVMTINTYIMLKHTALTLLIFAASFLFACANVQAQTFDHPTDFTRQDSLRGSITPEREWWDLTDYHLDVTLDIPAQSISGSNTISYRVLDPHDVMQIDLQEPMEITRIVQNGKELQFEREGIAWWVKMEEPQQKGDINQIIVEFEGAPVVAENPPWDGGLTWETDSNGKPFVANSNQGIGPACGGPTKIIRMTSRTVCASVLRRRTILWLCLTDDSHQPNRTATGRLRGTGGW